MVISLDTNIWIFALRGLNEYCDHILLNHDQFNIVVPQQVRSELQDNLSPTHRKEFYKIVEKENIQIDYQSVPQHLIELFYEKGLKKGDAEIGAFCQWRKIDIFVSDNRDFLKGLSVGHHFRVLSPETFCKKFGI